MKERMSDAEKAVIVQKRLNADEYEALLQIFGAFNNLLYYVPILEKRVRGFPNGWRDLKCISSMVQRLMGGTLATIPTEKLEMVSKDLQYCRVICKISRDVTGAKKTPVGYVDMNALERLISFVMSYDCAFCDRKGADIGGCELRKAINQCFPYDIAKVTTEKLCSLSGLDEFKEDSENDCE